MVCFDQSYARGSDAKPQRVVKLKELRRHGLRAFYYVSHAPFLFIARDDETLGQMLDRLIQSGVPASRFEQLQSDNAPPGENRTMPAAAAASVTVPAPSRMMCPACGKKEFKRWPLGWDAHAAHSCEGLAAGQPEARKAEFKNRFVHHLFERRPRGLNERVLVRGVQLGLAGNGGTMAQHGRNDSQNAETPSSPRLRAPDRVDRVGRRRERPYDLRDDPLRPAQRPPPSLEARYKNRAPICTLWGPRPGRRRSVPELVAIAREGVANVERYHFYFLQAEPV